MKIEIMMIGKISEKPYKNLIEQYLSRCQQRLSVSIISCKNTQEMIKRVSGRSLIVALMEQAACYDTYAFCEWVNKSIVSGINCITFCLGAAEGIDEQIKEISHKQLSLSPLTLNHQLALLVLAEQLYRSISIMFNEPYHK